MCSVHNWTQFEIKDDFENVFDNIWIQITIGILLVLGFISSAFGFFVSWFERSGEAGPFRTLINQLVTLSLDQISIMFLSGAILEISRIIFGPLPTFLCRPFLFIFLWACLNTFTFVTLISVIKFNFICVFKSIPVMCDNFLSLFLFVAVLLFNFLTLAGKFYIEEKIMIVERICTGIWAPEDEFKKGVPIGSVYAIVLFGVQFFLGIPIIYFKYVKSAKHQKSDMGSLVSSIITGFIFACGGFAFFKMQE